MFGKNGGDVSSVGEGRRQFLPLTFMYIVMLPIPGVELSSAAIAVSSVRRGRSRAAIQTRTVPKLSVFNLSQRTNPRAGI